MSWSLGQRVAALVACVLVVVSCSGTGEEAVDGPGETGEPTTSVETSPASSSEPEAVAGVLPLPEVDDACAAPVDLPVGQTEYSFEFEDRILPVGVDVAGASSLVDPIIVVSLHAGGFPWSQVMQAWEPIWPRLGQEAQRLLIFAPQADASDNPWWTESPDFNPSYLAAFFDRLEGVVCLETSPVLLTGFGQGTVAATQGHCAGVVEVELTAILLLVGMTKMVDCDPIDAVPILSIDRFEFDPTIGPHWDGRWDMPRAIDLELTGGLAATPDDLARWAEVYGCDGPPLSEEIPDQSGTLDRLTTVLRHRDCDADLTAIGIAGAAVRNRVFEPVALEQMLDVLEVEFARLLDDA